MDARFANAPKGARRETQVGDFRRRPVSVSAIGGKGSATIVPDDMLNRIRVVVPNLRPLASAPL